MSLSLPRIFLLLIFISSLGISTFAEPPLPSKNNTASEKSVQSLKSELKISEKLAHLEKLVAQIKAVNSLSNIGLNLQDQYIKATS